MTHCGSFDSKRCPLRMTGRGIGSPFITTVSLYSFLFCFFNEILTYSPPDLFFVKTGILPRSPYCVTIRARDQEYLYATPSTNLTDARACLEADMSKVTVQVQPVPAPLIQGQQQMNSRGSANPKKTIETISAEEMAIKRLIQRITYPNEIRVLRTAQNFSRLAQPEFMVNISRINVKFR